MSASSLRNKLRYLRGRPVGVCFLLVDRWRDGCDDKEVAAAADQHQRRDSERPQQVPGISSATADKILQMRKSYGPFKSVDDLLAIRGIGKKRLDKMRKYLVAGKSPSAPPKKPATSNSARAAKWNGCAKSAATTKSNPASASAARRRRKMPPTRPKSEDPESR